MEGIPVKISEKYKPPRKIALPASIQNKLNTEIKFEKYDFHLEQFVVTQMAKLREQQAKSSETNYLSMTESTPVTKFEENMTQSNILTPVPLKPYVQTSIINHQATGGFNISDFENDTSSPFDSVELKTINDMEELAHVLGGNSVGTPEWSSPENGSTTQIWNSGNSLYQMQYQPHTSIAKNNDNIIKPVDNETSIILQGLQKHIDERKAVSVIPAKKEEKYSSDQSLASGVFNSEKIIEKKRETLPNSFHTLTGPSQTIARRIAEMGFPLSRTSRAVEMFGPNQGKVIEFVLEVQSLEEQGYPDERAERALVISKFCKDEAIKLLDNIEQIMKLGFNEDEVICALVKHGFDRDKALDSLIS